MEEQNRTQPDPDIQPPVEKLKKNNTLLIVLLTILFLFASGIAVYAVYRNNQLTKEIAQLKFQFNQKSPTPTGITPTSNPTENWKTYSSGKFFFKYPSEFFLDERQADYLVLLFDKDNPQSVSISIDARLIGNYTDYKQAVSSTKKGLTNVETQDLNNGLKIKGTIGSGPGQGQKIIIALLRYQQGAIEIEALSPEPTLEKIFDQLVLTFR